MNFTTLASIHIMVDSGLSSGSRLTKMRKSPVPSFGLPLFTATALSIPLRKVTSAEWVADRSFRN